MSPVNAGESYSTLGHWRAGPTIFSRDDSIIRKNPFEARESPELFKYILMVSDPF
jgi:hypothetical protein